MITNANRSSYEANKGYRHLSRKRLYLNLIPGQFGLPLNFQPTPKLMEMGMKERHRKDSRFKPPKDTRSFLEAFLFPCHHHPEVSR